MTSNMISTETVLAQNAEVIRALGKRVVGDIIEIGRRLSHSKKLCGHGNWSPWLSREFGWGDDTALRYIQVAELAKSRNLRDLQLPVSGLYLLAAPSTPEEARQEAVERAGNGEVLSVREVRKLIEVARRKQEAETVEILAARETQIRAEYVPGIWSRKPPPPAAPVPERSYYLQFLRTRCHLVTEAMPLMNAEEFGGLVKSIKAHGQFDPIILIEHEGVDVILDGRCREIACGIAGVEPTYKRIQVDDPGSYWISANSKRVHLTKSQQAMSAAMLTEFGSGRATALPRSVASHDRCSEVCSRLRARLCRCRYSRKYAALRRIRSRSCWPT